MVTDEELVRAFEAGEVPDGGFHHEQHVRVAWFYLKHHSLSEALARFVRGLKHFAECQKRAGLYHETITVAYVLLINERLAESADVTWDEFARRHTDLLEWHPSVLGKYYRPETLASDRARQVFLMPDRMNADRR
jgi:N-formylglutamate deformylase